MKPRRRHPPRLAEWLITWAVPPQDRDSVLGDLDEAFYAEETARPRNPRLWYWKQACLFTASYSAERLRPGRVRSRSADSGGPVIRFREGAVLEGWWREIRVAFRALRKRPAFVAAAVGTLALGIGANTAIFSVINGALLQPLPFSEPDRLVFLSEWWQDQPSPGGLSMDPANFADLQASVRTIEGMTPYVFQSANLSGGDRPQRVRAIVVGQGFFSTLGIQPMLGRDFSAEEDTEGGASVAILSFGLWQDRFGGDPGLVDRDIVLNSEPHAVIGVMPEGSEFPGDPDVFVPLRFQGQEFSRGTRIINGIGRLAPGVTLEAAQQDMMAGYARLEADYPEENDNWSAWADPLHDLVVSPSQRRSLVLLGWSVGLVLLIACLNVANLLLVRAETRQREFAVRMALGAGKARLIPHFIAEGLLISVAGGLFGIAIAYGGLKGLEIASTGPSSSFAEIGLDATALLFALAVSVVAGIFVGLIPGVTRSLDLQADLKDGSRGSSGDGNKLRQALVVAEIAIAVVILAVAGLLGNSFYRVAKIDTGLEDPAQVLVAQVVLGDEYESTADRGRFFQDLLEEAQAMPGVLSAGLSNRLPLFGGNNLTNVYVLGNPERVSHMVEWRVVTPGFFEATGVVLEEGRMMDASDASTDTLQTIMINRELAQQLFPDESPLGHRIDLFENDEGPEVVGVVSNLRDLGHERPTPPGVYAAAGSAVAPSEGYLLIRAATDPLQLIPQLRQAVGDIDPNLPLFGIRTLGDVVRQRLGGRLFSMALLGIFASVALLLGALGIYGVMSYAVTERTREMGIRLALGAKSVDVVRLVLKKGVRLTAFGLALGLGGAWFSTRWISAQLFGVEANDPLTYTAVALLLGGISILASYMPARRASRTDPLDALQAE